MAWHGSEGLRARLFGRRQYLTVEVLLTNTGSDVFSSFLAKGGVFMSYRWLDKHGNLLVDGFRSAIIPDLAPGESRIMTVLTPLPPFAAKLRLSPLQEDCEWFYLANPSAGADVPLSASPRSRGAGARDRYVGFERGFP